MGLLILSGLDKKLESALLDRYDIPSIETNVLQSISFTHTDMNTHTKVTLSDTTLLKKAYFA